MYVRRALAEDHRGLLNVWERSVRATHDFLDESDVVALKPYVADALASEAVDWWVLVISSSDDPIGFLGFASDTIEALFLDPDYHRQGGGSFLVEYAQGLSSGALAVDVNEQNVAGLRFYEALGFSVVGRSPIDAGGRPFPILHMRRSNRD